MHLNPVTLLALLLALLLPQSSAMARSAEPLTVYAAASLTRALDEVLDAFSQTHTTAVIANYASSSTLARQIAQGAPADLYLSANLQWMDYLDNAGLLAQNSRRTLLGNRLVLVTAANSTLAPIELEPHWDLAASLGDGRLAVGDPDHVPAGRYAQQALEWLNLWSVAEPRLARANNVRGAVALVERGEVPLGIVYGSDAIGTGVRVLAQFPDQSHRPIDYPVAIVRNADSPDARALLAFLQTPAAAEIFRRSGFDMRQDD
ncbi:molybdate ABC transporter substrate-binding protein [Marinobacterium rhizophilum]|uniref:Molybdate ABC transporter substrate-binding protein n=1 Tax=Marinobacterium rhizophilum TaxID=420402 RepID=A0ABY5HN32_9GAMM|nr:molybdate ABC transporter substrate-binding protein [Marinobacterium rhizophilum]UTW13720.1 molybdate ABC transporter substrate-binding protein [Marinobacterium rhizophilum]